MKKYTIKWKKYKKKLQEEAKIKEESNQRGLKYGSEKQKERKTREN